MTRNQRYIKNYTQVMETPVFPRVSSNNTVPTVYLEVALSQGTISGVMILRLPDKSFIEKAGILPTTKKTLGRLLLVRCLLLLTQQHNLQEIVCIPRHKVWQNIIAGRTMLHWKERLVMEDIQRLRLHCRLSFHRSPRYVRRRARNLLTTFATSFFPF